MKSDQSPFPTTLILGVGNILLGDEGFGVHVIRKLRNATLPGYVRLEEGHTGGLNLLGTLEGIERLIVIDAMITDLPFGHIKIIRPDAGLREPNKRAVSFHQVGIIELIKIWGLIHPEPDLYFLIARPFTMEMSMELSPEMEIAAVRAAGLIIELCGDNFAGLERRQSLCLP